ncbi:hypothetical protein [Streptomyces sp. NRRL S-1022]|uniref:hypothetical protein n=1 Tax=Streptomyces sp. NRRL S-1022 TaxID=1463880 RepID=UPI000AE7857C|nr:hypothetical protein [Streptomyces sp. NRRL S-1022]
MNRNGFYQSLTNATESNAAATTIGALHRPATYDFVGLGGARAVARGAHMPRTL